MDPQTLMQLLQMHHQMSQMGGQLPSYAQPQATGLPSTATPQPAGADPAQQQHHGGFSPLMALSPISAMFGGDPKRMGMFALSPLASMFGAFK